MHALMHGRMHGRSEAGEGVMYCDPLALAGRIVYGDALLDASCHARGSFEIALRGSQVL